jgi:hypothetical protein
LKISHGPVRAALEGSSGVQPRTCPSNIFPPLNTISNFPAGKVDKRIQYI